MKSYPVGIDLGTTHSLLSVMEENGEIVLVPGSDGAVLTHSAVSLGEDGKLLIGAAAHARRVSFPETTHVAFKRHIGSGKTFLLKKQSYSASDLSAFILRKLNDDFDAAYPGCGIDKLVISVPAYFGSAQREATMLAAELAGLPRPRLINEPTAAALAYGLAERECENTFIVLDLGGGTFDVSIIEMFDGVIEVRASAGDARLGGEDFSEAIALHLAKAVGLEWEKASAEARAALMGGAEVLKRSLSHAESAEVDLVIGKEAKSCKLTRSQFEELVAPLLLRLRKPIERSLYDSKLEIDSIDRVILVGGATRMPMIRSLAGRLLRKLPESGLHPDEAIARGAAVQAGMLAKNKALDDMVMTDVAPFSLGIRSRISTPTGHIENGFSPIIERNTTLPTSRVEYFSTLTDGQREMTVEVYQGESPLALENVLIGKTSVSVPPGPAGKESMAVRFSYDSSGLLHVGITVATTQDVTELVIEGRGSAMSKSEKAERLRALAAFMQHPREDQANIILMEKLKGLYAMLLGPDRAEVTNLIAEFETALSKQDPKLIERVRKDLGAEVARIEANYVR